MKNPYFGLVVYYLSSILLKCEGIRHSVKVTIFVASYGHPFTHPLKKLNSAAKTAQQKYFHSRNTQTEISIKKVRAK